MCTVFGFCGAGLRQRASESHITEARHHQDPQTSSEQKDPDAYDVLLVFFLFVLNIIVFSFWNF